MRITVENLFFSYSDKAVLKNINLSLDSSEILCIVGPNGCGKSTLIKCINSILCPQKGKIKLNKSNIKDLQQKEIARCLGYVPQGTEQVYTTTVIDAVLLGRRPHSSWRSSAKDIDIVINVLTMMGLDDIALQEYSHLSGGQRQRVLIARALAQQPKSLLLDEPTSALDIAYQLEVMDILKERVKDYRISVIMVIHDLNLAARYADKVVLLKEGEVYSTGTPKDVFTAENIATVYGVKVAISDQYGKVAIVPVGRLAKDWSRGKSASGKK